MIHRLSHRAIILANEFYYPNVTRGHCGGLVKAEAFNEITANTSPAERSSSYGIRPFPQANCCPPELDGTSQLPWKLDQTQSLDLSKNFDNEFLEPQSNPSIWIIRSLELLRVVSRNLFKLENLELQFYNVRTWNCTKLLDARKIFKIDEITTRFAMLVNQRSFFQGSIITRENV